jgi:hypothetical protein
MRRRGAFVVVAVVAALIPAAIAWACNPQAHLSVSNGAPSPGESLTVSGSYFNSADTINVSGPGVSGTEPGPSFTVTGTAPSSPGTYTVTATVQDGPRAGLSRSASFEVVAPAAPSAPPSNSSSPSFSQPKAPHVAGVGGGGGTVHNESGQPVFAGSVAPSSGSSGGGGGGGGAFFSGSGGAASTQAAAPSERAATADVWSAFAPGKAPSLNSAAALPDGGTGSELSLGIILLSVGLLALVGGLSAAEVTRRRRLSG